MRRHILELRHSPGHHCRYFLNDIELYDRAVDDNLCPRLPISHVLGPGENRVRVDVREGRRNPLRPNSTPVFEALVLFDPGTGPAEDQTTLHKLTFPELLEAYPQEERKLPFTHRETFLMPEDQREPLWWRSPPESFPPEGTPGQHQAVRELHEAFDLRDRERFLAATRTKMDMHRQTYGVQPETTPDASRAKVGSLLAQPWDVRPLVIEDLVFDRRGDGRVAQVEHKDGSPALLARHQMDPSQRWAANLWLARVDGEWRVIW